MMGVKPGPVDKMVVMSAKLKPKQKMMADGMRSTVYKACQGELPDPSLLQISEVYAGFTDMACVPLITTMGISSEIPLVNSALGKVQAGSPLSYQQPLTTSRQITLHPDAPSPPTLPLKHYRLDPSNCVFVCSEKEQLFLKSLETTWEMANIIEAATKDQSQVSEWHQLRRPRLTSSHFREVCHVRGPDSAEKLADRIPIRSARSVMCKCEKAMLTAPTLRWRRATSNYNNNNNMPTSGKFKGSSLSPDLNGVTLWWLRRRTC